MKSTLNLKLVILLEYQNKGGKHRPNNQMGHINADILINFY